MCLRGMSVEPITHALVGVNFYRKQQLQKWERSDGKTMSPSETANTPNLAENR